MIEAFLRDSTGLALFTYRNRVVAPDFRLTTRLARLGLSIASNHVPLMRSYFDLSMINRPALPNLRSSLLEERLFEALKIRRPKVPKFVAARSARV